MKRSVTFLCLSVIMCVIVCLQLVNHFVMVRNSDSECNCDAKSGDENRPRRDAKHVFTSPIEKSAKLNEYVSGMLELLENMNELEQAQLGTNFKRLYAVLQDVRDSKNRVTNTRKLSEKIIPSPSLAKSKSGDTQEVCPEKFLGDTLTYGYPFFRKGFATLNCTQFVPMEKLVTVVFDDAYTSKINPPAYVRVLKGIAKYYPTLNVVYITKDNPGGVEKIKSNVKTVRVKDSLKQGEMWDTALSHVTTKYVLIAPQLTEFDDDIDFKRLVRILSNQPDVTFVSAAYRTRDGHWDIGCLQSMFQNYTLTLQGGYYISFWDCVVCDFLPGPWVARTKEIRELQFDKRLVTAKISNRDLLLHSPSDSEVKCNKTEV